jgi:hypothetical protein
MYIQIYTHIQNIYKYASIHMYILIYTQPFEDFLSENVSILAGSNSTSLYGFVIESSGANTACFLYIHVYIYIHIYIYICIYIYI